MNANKTQTWKKYVIKRDIIEKEQRSSTTYLLILCVCNIGTYVSITKYIGLM